MYDSDKNIKETVGYAPPQSHIAHSGLSGVRAYVHGIKRGVSKWKTVAGLYLVELSWVFLFSLPVYFVFRNLTAKRPAGENLIKSFDIELLSEMFMDHPVLASSLIGLFLAGALSYFVISAFFIGGLIGTEVFSSTGETKKDKKTSRKTDDKPGEKTGEKNENKDEKHNEELNKRSGESNGEGEDDTNSGSDTRNISGSEGEKSSESEEDNLSGGEGEEGDETNEEDKNGKIKTEQDSGYRIAPKTAPRGAPAIALRVARNTGQKTAPRNSKDRGSNNKGRFAAESVKSGPPLLLTHILYMIPGLLFLFILLLSLELGSSLGDDLSHSGKMLVSILSAVPALALITLWDTALDFSRVWFVHCHPRGWRGLLKGFGAGWVVLWQRGAAAVLLHIGYLVLSLIVSLVMLMVFVMLNMVEAFPLFVTFLIVQVFAILRTFVRSSSLLAHHAFIAGRK